MVKIKASVQSAQDKHFIDIALDSDVVRIPISEDNPNQVKSAFNKLLERTRSGQFTIELESDSDDLFSHVAKEYIAQLNRELQEIWKEMKQHKLVGSEAR
ncbi:MAG TPA: hypothetical protein VES88_18315 [Gemmatimonadaceae bacterium]|nr:hypothetical protein [Gemmatimonadaceae bacterium]